MATFNILHGRSTVDGQVDVDRFAKAISRLDADVLALQEVDRAQVRSFRTDLTAVAAEAMNAVGAEFAAALAGAPGGRWAAATGAEDAAEAAYGVALISRYPLTLREVVRLPALPIPVPFRPPGHSIVMVRDEPRVALMCAVDSPEGRIAVCSTHLTFLPGWQRVQLRRALRSLRREAEPRLLLGDLNMPPARAVRLTGMQPLASDVTFPAEQPREQIDHILADGLPSGPSEARRLEISDHRALVVDLP